MTIEELRRECGCDPACRWMVVDGAFRALHVPECAYIRRPRTVVTFTPTKAARFDALCGIAHFDAQRTGDEPI